MWVTAAPRFAAISTDGKVYTCLFALQGHDLRTLLRDGSESGEARIAHHPFFFSKMELGKFREGIQFRSYV